MKVRGWTLATSWGVVVLWCFVTLLVATASITALITPTWFIRHPDLHPAHPAATFGVWAWCVGVKNEKKCAQLGENAGEESVLQQSMESALPPSAVWVMVGALYGSGGALLAITGLATLIMPLLPSTQARWSLAQVAGNIQAAAVSLQAVGLVLYPLGLGSSFVRSICGNSATIYSSGICDLGYAYMLAIVSTSLAAYSPLLARLTTYKNYSDYWSNLNYM